MHTGTEGEACACNLRNPPEFAKSGMSAGHHSTAHVIHHSRADLRGCVDRVGVREGAKERVAFRAVVAGDSAARGVGVEYGGAVADSHEGVPEFLLAWGGHRAFHCGFYGTA